MIFFVLYPSVANDRGEGGPHKSALEMATCMTYTCRLSRVTCWPQLPRHVQSGGEEGQDGEGKQNMIMK